MKKIIVALLLTTVFASVLFAASLVEPSVITTPLSAQDNNTVKLAILAGSRDKGWVPKVVSDTEITAMLNNRNHSVTVSIVFSKTGYTIKYKDSVNMDYDAKNNQIHRKYNQWVANLNKAISKRTDMSK